MNVDGSGQTQLTYKGGSDQGPAWSPAASAVGTAAAREAIAILKLNVDSHSESFNVYDSLAAAYLAKGEK